MKLKGLKGLCAGLALAMLTSLAPMNIMADTTEDTITQVTTNADGSVTITANADTYLDRNGDKTSGNNYTPLGDKTSLAFQNNGKYTREAWIRFNLSKVQIPVGKQIDTAKITVALSSY